MHDELDDSDTEMPPRLSNKRVLVVEISDNDDDDDDFVPVDIGSGTLATGLQNTVGRCALIESQ